MGAMGDQNGGEGGGAPLTQLLIVAGASGAGKSTFIRLLAERGLPDGIQRELPTQCELWPVIEANRFFKRGADVETVLAPASGAPGIILHYDLSYIHRLGISQYELDPLHGVLQRADSLMFVTVIPSREALIEQLSGRMQARNQHKIWPRRAWRNLTRRWKQAKNVNLKGARLTGVFALYEDEARLRECYAQWQRFIGAWARSATRTRTLNVEPVTGAGAGPMFRLTESGVPVATTVVPGSEH